MLQYAKAVMAGTVAFCGSLGTALTDGTVSGVEWTTIVSTTVVAIGTVWGIKNADQ